MDLAASEPQRNEVQGLLNQINVTGQALLGGRDGARTTLIDEARSLIAALETPTETISWIAWAEPARLAALRIAIDLGLFEKLMEDNGTVKTKDVLASEVGADPKLIARILKHLASMQVIQEVDVNCYKPTKLTSALTIPKFRDAIPFSAHTAGPVFQKLPAFFAQNQYASSTNIEAGPYQYGRDTRFAFWLFKKYRPRLEQAFHNHMAGYHQGRPSWMDEGFYPVNERLVHGMRSGKEEIAIVHIGGNVGYELLELRRKYPNLPGRLVLQDRPDVIAQVTDASGSIEATSHDYFREQPVKGARAYYMHSILRMWSDEVCRDILQQISGAMEKGYSKLLINENIVPDRGADWKMTSLDWFMMALNVSAERTQTEWTELLRSAGFKVEGIWTADSATEILLEAVLEGDDAESV
ncbi:MAG: hypothetical protein Q9201_006716 [Fulgogasparrea decipioides]